MDVGGGGVMCVHPSLSNEPKGCTIALAEPNETLDDCIRPKLWPSASPTASSDPARHVVEMLRRGKQPRFGGAWIKLTRHFEKESNPQCLVERPMVVVTSFCGSSLVPGSRLAMLEEAMATPSSHYRLRRNHAHHRVALDGQSSPQRTTHSRQVLNFLLQTQSSSHCPAKCTRSDPTK